MNYQNASREQRLDSELAEAARKFKQGTEAITKYLCKLDGHARKEDCARIGRFNDVEPDSLRSVNWRELNQEAYKMVEILNRFDPDVWRNEDDFYSEISKWLQWNDYSYKLEWKTPQWTFEIEVGCGHVIKIYNGPNIDVTVEYKGTVIMETRNMQHIYNYMTVMSKLL